MKSVYVNNILVQLNNHNESEELRPNLVRAAVESVYGNIKNKSIVNDNYKAYRVTSGGNIRKITNKEAYLMIFPVVVNCE